MFLGPGSDRVDINYHVPYNIEKSDGVRLKNTSEHDSCADPPAYAKMISVPG